MPDLNDLPNIYIPVDPGETLTPGLPVVKRDDGKWYHIADGEAPMGIAMGGRLVMQRGFIPDVDMPDDEVYMR